jgi:hypothetical protein
MAIALHHPEKSKNPDVIRMTREQLEEYARTPEKGLPKRVKRKSKKKQK